MTDKRPVTILGCEMFQPVCIAREDIPKLSRPSKEEIAIHNKMWAKTCGQGKPPCNE